MSDKTGFTHCALCGMRFWTRACPRNDYMDYCTKHHDTILFTLQPDDIIDATESLTAMSLYSELLDEIGVGPKHFEG